MHRNVWGEEPIVEWHFLYISFGGYLGALCTLGSAHDQGDILFIADSFVRLFASDMTNAVERILQNIPFSILHIYFVG